MEDTQGEVQMTFEDRPGARSVNLGGTSDWVFALHHMSYVTGENSAFDREWSVILDSSFVLHLNVNKMG